MDVLERITLYTAIAARPMVVALLAAWMSFGLAAVAAPAQTPPDQDEEQPADEEDDGGEQESDNAERQRITDRQKRIQELRARQRAREQEREEGKAAAQPPSRPSRTPTRTPTSRREPTQPATPAKQPELVMPDDQLDAPAEQREYTFSTEGTYEDLLSSFSRMSGLALLGDPPSGNVTLKSTEVLDYDTAFRRVRSLLFKHPENYWMRRDGNVLEVKRLIEFKRMLEYEQIFPNVAAFQAADLEPDDIAMLIFSPTSGSVDDLTEVRDFLPDYVLSAPMPDRNAMTIFALVGDIQKFLSLVELFTQDQDPRIIKKIPVQHMSPSAALEALGSLMDLDPSAAAAQSASRRSRGGRRANTSTATESDLGIMILPDDTQSVLIVRALISDIEEIERLLPFVDVPESSEFDPIIIPLQHVSTDKIIKALTPLLAVAGGEDPPASKSRRARRSATPGSVSGDDVTVVPDARTNKLIVVGSAEGVKWVRQIVALFDVEDPADKPLFIELQFADAKTQAEQILPVVTNIRSTWDAQEPLSITADETGNALVVVGSKKDRELVQEFVQRADVPGAEPTIHAAELKFAVPSEIVGVLAQFETGSDGQPATPTTRSRRKGRSSRRSSPAPATGRFIPVDAARTLYVVCTEDEWKDVYLPRIEQLDTHAPIPAPSLVAVEFVDPEEALNKLSQWLSASAIKVPGMIAVEGGILIAGPSDEQLQRIGEILEQIDIDPAEIGIVRRTFELAHAEPATVREVVMAMISAEPPRAVVRPSSRRRNRNKEDAPRISAGGEDIKIIELTDSVMVSASEERMEEIAELIAEVDVPQGDATEMRVYPFPASANVSDIASSLGALFGGRPLKRRGGEAEGITAGGVQFIPRPTSHRLLVSAPAELFPEIENAIELLGSDAGILPIGYEFITVVGNNAADVAELIEPMLTAKAAELVNSGELVIPDQAKGKEGGSYITLQPDPRGDRLIIAAPQRLVDEAKDLVAMIDRPADELEERIIRTVELTKAQPEEMVGTIQRMLAGANAGLTTAPAPRRRGGRRGSQQPAVASPEIQDATMDVAITPAPGGDAVVLMGTVRDVDEVEGWVHQLDQMADGSRKEIKVYDVYPRDPELIADMIMAVVSPSGSVREPKSPPPSEDGDFGFFFDTKIERRSQDIFIKGDKYDPNLLIAASPKKLREIDDLIAQFLGRDESGKPTIPTQVVKPPSKLVTLKHVDPFDAVYKLDGLLDVIWAYAERPKIDYIPFTKTMVIKGNPDHFQEVEDIINEYVDIPPDEPEGKSSVLSVFGTGQTAEDLGMLLKINLEAAGMEVDLVNMNPDLGYELEKVTPSSTPPVQINPCMVPATLMREIAALGATVIGQSEESQPADNTDAKRAAEDKMLEMAAEKLKEEATAGAIHVNDASKDDAEPKKPQIRIRVDNTDGRLYIEGQPDAIDQIEDLIEQIKEEVKELPALPDIRLYRLKHISPTKAAEILDELFNDRSRRNAQAAAQAQAQAAARRAAAQRRAQQRNQQNQGDGGNQGGRQPQGEGEDQEQDDQKSAVPSMAELSIRVYPDARSRTIILMAATELYPKIEYLLASIDKDPIAPLDYRIFTLENLIASEVEEQLKAMLGLDSSGSRRTTTRNRRGGGAAQQQPDDMIQMDLPGNEGVSVAAGEITLSSNAVTNSIMVMAPKEAMDLVERFINDMEALAAPKFITRTFELAHADVTQIVPELDKFFRDSGRKIDPGEFDPQGINAPVFMQHPRTNSLIVRALDRDMDRVGEIIAELDKPYADAASTRDYSLNHAVASQVATTVSALFADKQAKGGDTSAKAVKIIGDDQANLIFVTAPPEMHEEIGATITRLDEEAGVQFQPRIIKVALGTPTDIAKKIGEVFSKRKGKGADRVQITGNDTGKQLIVVAPDEVFNEVQQLVKEIDQAPSGVEMMVYPLEHAVVGDVLGSLNSLVQQSKSQLQSAGMPVDVFSAAADERTNSLIVMAGPISKLLVERLLSQLDIPPRDPTQIVTVIYQLATGNAEEIARNVNSIYGTKKKDGVEPPKAEANPSSNVVIVRGTKKQVEEVYAQVIKPLEDSVVATALEMNDKRFELQFGKADEIAQALLEFFNSKFEAYKKAGVKNIKPSELSVAITPDVDGNALLVTASEGNIAIIESMLEDLDTETASANALVTKTYTLEYADPGAVREVINGVFRKQGKVADKERVEAIVEPATQSVVVIANPVHQEDVQQLIAELDVDTGVSNVRKTYNVADARASDLANTINQVLGSSRKRSRTGKLPVEVVANDALNVLVLSGSQRDIDGVMPLIEELDRKPDEMTGLVVEVYQLKFADPGSTIGTISNAFPRLGGQKPEDIVRASYAHGTAALVVAASQENQAKVKELLDKIDVESNMQRDLQLVQLQEANAAELANTMGQLYGRTRRTARDEQPVSFTPDPGTNSLLVYASEQEMTEIRPLIASLDVKPEYVADRTFRSFKIQYAESWGVKQMIDETFRLQGRNPNPRDIVTTMADWGSNSIVVSATPERLDEVAKLIEAVDRKDADQRQFHVIPIEHAKAEEVGQALREMFVRGSVTRRGQETVSITWARGTDALLVKANQDEYDEIMAVVEQLDTADSGIGEQVEIIPLRYTDATEMLTILQEYLRDSSGGGRGGELAGDMRISAATSTNALVVSGSKDQVEQLKDVIARIDVEVEDAGNSPKIIRLQYAEAATVQQSLSQLFTEQRGRGRGNQGGLMTPVIVADEGSNSLFVRASVVDFNQIEQLVQQLDNEDAGSGVALKIVQLAAGTNATTIADLLDRLLEDIERNTPRSGRRASGQQSQRVSISAHAPSNSLVLAGPKAKFEEIEVLIRQLEESGPAGGRQTVVIPLKNLSPDEVGRLIGEVASETQNTGGSSRRRRR